ncbi:MAG: hypothetical protein LAP21_25300 [Acidobacteriia bacterium]|nr:hypothetical protein [Terriglobia bacterium]
MFSPSGQGDHSTVRIVFTLTSSVREDYRAEDFLHSIAGRIMACHENDKKAQQVGYINASLAQFGHALDHGICADQLGDGLAGGIAEYWERLFDVENGRWKAALQDEFEVVERDLLIIDCIEIYPQFRGQGLGLATVERTIDTLGAGCGLVACKPWPLQFTPAFAKDRRKMQRLRSPNTDEMTSLRKLQRYWSRAGFWPFGESGIYVMSTSQRQ